MEKLITDFLSNKPLTSAETLIALNTVALFNIQDMHNIYSVKVGRLRVDGKQVYTAIHERFDIVDVNKNEDEYNLSHYILQCRNTAKYYKFAFDYNSYGGYSYDSGTWRSVEKRTKTIAYYTDL